MENQTAISSVKQRKTARNYGIDLLRCFAMAMVVMLHTLSRSGLLTETEIPSLKYEVVWFIEIFCYCAVNCFVIISGFVGLRSKFRLSRILLLWLQVVFYNVVFTVTIQAIHGDINAVDIVRDFLPVTTSAYWFFTQYFVLCFLMPFINKLIVSISLRQNGIFVGVMILFFSVIPMLCAMPVDFLGKFESDIFFTKRGYSVIWMAVMYILGAFIKRLAEENILCRIKSKVLITLVICSDFLIWIIHYFCVNGKKSVSHYFVIAYTSPFVVISAVSMVILFSRMHFNRTFEKLIAFFSAGAFSVYLIHSNSEIYPIFTELVSELFEMRVLKLIPCLLFIVVFVFIVCTVADFARNKLFKIIGINKLFRKVDDLPIMKKICSIDDK